MNGSDIRTDEANRNYYVPDTVVELTKAELKTYVQDAHSRYPMKKLGDDGVTETNMTDAEVDACHELV